MNTILSKIYASNSSQELAELKRGLPVKNILRITVSVIAIIYVYSTVDIIHVFQSLLNIRSSTAVLLIAMYCLGQLISIFKWKALLNENGTRPSFLAILRAYLLGMFINTAGVGTVGGDVVRALALKAKNVSKTSLLATVVADRAHGLATLLLIGSVAAAIFQPSYLPPLAKPISIATIFLILVGWTTGPIIIEKIAGHTEYGKKFSIFLKNSLPTRPGLVAKITLLSAAMHSIQILMHLVIAAELGVLAPVGYLFAVIPLVNAASSLPISLNGLGVREALYIMVFTPLGASNEIAVAFGAIWFVTITFVSLIGGLFASIPIKDPIRD